MSNQLVFVPSGATGVTIDVDLLQNAGAASPGNPLTGLVYNTASLTAYDYSAVTAGSAIALVTQTPTGAWASGGFCARDATNAPGRYRFDLPNGLVPASGELNVVFNGAASLETHTLKIIPTQQLLKGQLLESYAATTVVPTAEQALNMIISALLQFNGAGGTLTLLKRDNATTAMVGTFAGGANATGLTQTT